MELRSRRVLAILGLSFLLGILPFLLSLLSTRYGWVSGSAPDFWNDLGTLFIIPGLFILVWTVRTWDATRGPNEKNVVMDRVPPRLLTQGPYHYGRNPIYLGYLLIWLAWTIFYGSIVVLTVFVILCIIFQFIVVPREERVLSEKFGEEYRRYKSEVPRWFGFPRRKHRSSTEPSGPI